MLDRSARGRLMSGADYKKAGNEALKLMVANTDAHNKKMMQIEARDKAAEKLIMAALRFDRRDDSPKYLRAAADDLLALY